MEPSLQNKLNLSKCFSLTQHTCKTKRVKNKVSVVSCIWRPTGGGVKESFPVAILNCFWQVCEVSVYPPWRTQLYHEEIIKTESHFSYWVFTNAVIPYQNKNACLRKSHISKKNILALPGVRKAQSVWRRAGRPVFESWQSNIFLFYTKFRPPQGSHLLGGGGEFFEGKAAIRLDLVPWSRMFEIHLLSSHMLSWHSA